MDKSFDEYQKWVDTSVRDQEFYKEGARNDGRYTKAREDLDSIRNSLLWSSLIFSSTLGLLTMSIAQLKVREFKFEFN
jgi:hypothetical protein